MIPTHYKHLKIACFENQDGDGKIYIDLLEKLNYQLVDLWNLIEKNLNHYCGLVSETMPLNLISISTGSVLCNSTGSILCNSTGSVLCNSIGSVLCNSTGSVLCNSSGSVLCNSTCLSSSVAKLSLKHPPPHLRVCDLQVSPISLNTQNIRAPQHALLNTFKLTWLWQIILAMAHYI